MKYQVLALVVCFLFAFATLAMVDAAGAPSWAFVPVYLLIVAAQQVYCQILVPRSARARLLKAVDPAAGPPLGAAPADSPLIRHLDELGEVQDWDAMKALLSDDFELVMGKRRFGQKVYIRVLKMTRRQLPGEHTTDEVVVHPDEPDVLWVRSTSSGKPRFGPGFVATSWSRFSLTPDGSRVREIADAGVVHVT